MFVEDAKVPPQHTEAHVSASSADGAAVAITTGQVEIVPVGDEGEERLVPLHKTRVEPHGFKRKHKHLSLLLAVCSQRPKWPLLAASLLQQLTN